MLTEKKSWSSYLLFALIVMSFLSGGCESESAKNAREVKELRKGAVNGSSMAQTQLASVYALGSNGIEINPSAALFWLRKVAVKGNADAQFAVGIAFYSGEGVGRNEDEGLYWINQAAQQGHSQAKSFLERTSHRVVYASSNPRIWGYLFSNAIFGDMSDGYGWLFWIAFTVAIGSGPIGIPAFFLWVIYFGA